MGAIVHGWRALANGVLIYSVQGFTRQTAWNCYAVPHLEVTT